MRRMQTTTQDGKVPALPSGVWEQLVEKLIGRDLTGDEWRRVEKMAQHNWTARVVAEDILGRDLTAAEVKQAMVAAGVPLPEPPYPAAQEDDDGCQCMGPTEDDSGICLCCHKQKRQRHHHNAR